MTRKQRGRKSQSWNEPTIHQPKEKRDSQLFMRQAKRRKSRVIWTDFAKKTLWDWLNLAGVVLVPIMLGVLPVVLNVHQGELAADQQREVTLKDYINEMDDLVLNYGLQDAKNTKLVRNIARVKTLIVLRKLDGYRKGLIIQFLFEMHFISTDNVIINLGGADLSDLYLENAYLHNTYLAKVNLKRAHLGGANLSGSVLSNANLSGADMSKANLNDVYLDDTNLRNTNLVQADLKNSIFAAKTMLNNADLTEANLTGAEVQEEERESRIPIVDILTKAKSLKWCNHAYWQVTLLALYLL